MNVVPAAAARSPSARRRLWIAAIVALALAVGLFFAYRVVLEQMRTRVLSALGPQSEIGEVRLSLRALELSRLRIRAPAGWPARETLAADRVTIVPDLASLFSDRLRVSSIRIDGAYLSLLRAANGKLRVLPNLTERGGTTKPAGAGGVAGTGVVIEKIVLTGSRLSFFDAAVANPPLEVKLEEVGAQVTNLRMPDLKGNSDLELTAAVAGIHRGSLTLRGWMEFASRDSDIKVKANGVDIVALEPYLIKAAETGVKRGTLDLDLAARVAARRIAAPGRLVLKDLELQSAGGSFMGMPRDAVIGMLREHDGRIDVPFKIEGNLDDPNFSLDAAFKARVGIAAAAALGISIKGLISELGGLREKSGVEKVDAVIDSVKKLLGR